MNSNIGDPNPKLSKRKSKRISVETTLFNRGNEIRQPLLNNVVPATLVRDPSTQVRHNIGLTPLAMARSKRYQQIILSERKCFNCEEFGHLARDCKVTYFLFFTFQTNLERQDRLYNPCRKKKTV